MPKSSLFADGEYSAPEIRSSWKVSCSGQAGYGPSAGISQTWGTPVISVKNETRRPSGDQLGPQAPRILRYRKNS